MPSIPHTENAAVIRTDFTDDSAWESLCEAVIKPVAYPFGKFENYEFRASVDFLDDRRFEAFRVEELLSSIPRDYPHTFLFVVDHMALSHPDQPILAVDLDAEPGRTFRVIPSEMWSVENNLSIANMDFAEFADAVDRDGIFRGFPKS